MGHKKTCFRYGLEDLTVIKVKRNNHFKQNTLLIGQQKHCQDAITSLAIQNTLSWVNIQ